MRAGKEGEEGGTGEGQDTLAHPRAEREERKKEEKDGGGREGRKRERFDKKLV